MKIALLENGIDSLQRGFKSFLEFEKNTVRRAPCLEDYFALKSAVLSTHHGIEILLKYILSQKSEFLIISNIDKSYMTAYQEKEAQNKNSVFETSKAEKVHTITYGEALERIMYFSNVKMSKNLIVKLNDLNVIRNSLTHAEIDIKDDIIVDLFRDLLNEIDVFFFKTIGNDYKTMSGYSILEKNYSEYMKILDTNEMEIKKKAIEAIKCAIDKADISIGENESIVISKITKAKAFIAELKTHNLFLGMDMYNGFCSGDIEIGIEDDTHFYIFAKDNDAKYIFKFKNMILCFPVVASNTSPVIIFESDSDEYDEKVENNLSDDYRGGQYVEGLYFIKDKRVTFDTKEIQDFYNKYQNSSEVPEHYTICKFLNSYIFACVNVQKLVYGKFISLLIKSNDNHLDAFKLEALLKK